MKQFRFEVKQDAESKKKYLTVFTLEGNFSTGKIQNSVFEFETFEDLQNALNIAFVQMSEFPYKHI